MAPDYLQHVEELYQAGYLTAPHRRHLIDKIKHTDSAFEPIAGVEGFEIFYPEEQEHQKQKVEAWY